MKRKTKPSAKVRVAVAEDDPVLKSIVETQKLMQKQLSLLTDSITKERSNVAKSEDKAKAPNSRLKGLCHHCRKPGHFRPECPELAKKPSETPVVVESASRSISLKEQPDDDESDQPPKGGNKQVIGTNTVVVSDKQPVAPDIVVGIYSYVSTATFSSVWTDAVSAWCIDAADAAVTGSDDRNVDAADAAVTGSDDRKVDAADAALTGSGSRKGDAADEALINSDSRKVDAVDAADSNVSVFDAVKC